MHVQTADYLTSSSEMSTSLSTYAPYITWAYVRNSQAAAARAAGIKVVLYTNPLMPHANAYEQNLIETTYANVQAKDCSGNVIRSWNNTGYLADVRSASAAAYVKNVEDYYVNSAISANPTDPHPYDALYVDDANSLGGTSGTPCNYDASTWTTDMDAAIAADGGYPTIVNTLSTSESSVASKVAGLNASNIVGGEYEECFNNGHWLSEEMSQLQTIALLKSQGKGPGPGFWCYLDNTNSDGATVIPYRQFAYASFLLTYDPDYSVFQESFTTPSTFSVFPETGFVPLDPVSQPSQISDLMTASGAYVRQYNSCYYHGALVGACMIAVNPQTYSTSIPNSYLNSMVITGSGVLDGGAVDFTGGPVTTLAPNTAAILVGLPASQATPAPMPTPLTVSGQIVWESTSATKFQLQQSDGTKIYVYYSSSTQINYTGTPQIGQYMQATGPNTSPMTANAVWLSDVAFSTATPAPTPTPTPVPTPTPTPVPTPTPTPVPTPTPTPVPTPTPTPVPTPTPTPVPTPTPTPVPTPTPTPVPTPTPTPVPTPTPTPKPTPTPTPVPTPTPTPAPTPFTVSGKIVWESTSATKFQLQQSDGTTIYVYYQSTTQKNFTGTPQLGQYMKATGANTSPLYADAVWLSNSAF